MHCLPRGGRTVQAKETKKGTHFIVTTMIMIIPGAIIALVSCKEDAEDRESFEGVAYRG